MVLSLHSRARAHDAIRRVRPPGQWNGAPYSTRCRPSGLVLGPGLVGGICLAGSGSLLRALGLAVAIAVLGWWLLRRQERLASLGSEVDRLRDALAAHARDLSRASAEADQRAREADSLLEIALATGATLDEPQLLGHIARGAARACRAGRCTILRLDESGTWVTAAVSEFADRIAGRPERED